MAPNWDTAAQDKYKTLAQLSIGLIVGMIVLLPSIVGLIHPPYVIKWALPWMLGLATVSAALLGLAMLRTMLGTSSPPERLLGLGNWSGLVALALLVVFILTNLWSDSRAPPRILAVKVDPPSVEPGKYVQFDAEAVDQDSDELAYAWQFDGKTVSSRRNAYVKAPATPGVYQVKLTVSDDRSRAEADASFEVAASAPAPAAVVVPPAPAATAVPKPTSTKSSKRR